MDIQREPHSRRRMYAAWSAALLAVVLISLGLGRLQPAAPAVERGTLWFGVVERGEMIREVHAAGTLVPEHVRIVAAVTAGRVERLPVRLGDTVGRGTIHRGARATRTSSSRRSNRTRRRRALGARCRPPFLARSAAALAEGGDCRAHHAVSGRPAQPGCPGRTRSERARGTKRRRGRARCGHRAPDAPGARRGTTGPDDARCGGTDSTRRGTDRPAARHRHRKPGTSGRDAGARRGRLVWCRRLAAPPWSSGSG